MQKEEELNIWSCNLLPFLQWLLWKKKKECFMSSIRNFSEKHPVCSFHPTEISINQNDSDFLTSNVPIHLLRYSTFKNLDTSFAWKVNSCKGDFWHYYSNKIWTPAVQICSYLTKIPSIHSCSFCRTNCSSVHLWSMYPQAQYLTPWKHGKKGKKPLCSFTRMETSMPCSLMVSTQYF